MALIRDSSQDSDILIERAGHTQWGKEMYAGISSTDTASSCEIPMRAIPFWSFIIVVVESDITDSKQQAEFVQNIMWNYAYLLIFQLFHSHTCIIITSRWGVDTLDLLIRPYSVHRQQYFTFTIILNMNLFLNGWIIVYLLSCVVAPTLSHLFSLHHSLLKCLQSL